MILTQIFLFASQLLSIFILYIVLVIKIISSGITFHKSNGSEELDLTELPLTLVLLRVVIFTVHIIF